MPNVECSVLKPRLSKVKGHLIAHVRDREERGRQGGLRGVGREEICGGSRFRYRSGINSSAFKCDLQCQAEG